jgi:tetratricopeptide (TPR) repeat protein
MAIDKADQILDEDSDNENALYILGANYGFRAMASMKKYSYLDAVWSVKNSNKYLKKALERNPGNYDAYLGLGLFNYAISLVPGVFKWTLSLAGISGNKDEGIKYLKIAYKSGKYSKTEAAYYLSQIYTDSYLEYDEALKYLFPLIKKYPGNSLFRYSYSVILLKNREPKEAENLLSDIVEQNHPKFKQITSFSKFLLGDISFRYNKFSKAIEYYDNFLTTSQDIDYSGIAYYRTAICYEMMNNHFEATKYYLKAQNGNLDLPDDAYAKRKSVFYLDYPPSKPELQLIKASNSIEVGNYNSAIDSILKILPNLKTDRLKGEAFVYLSDAYFSIGKTNESISYAESALKLNINNEKWIKPFAYYFGARAYLKAEDVSKAKNYVKKAKKFSEFDYEEKLNAFLNALNTNL